MCCAALTALNGGLHACSHALLGRHACRRHGSPWPSSLKLQGCLALTIIIDIQHLG